MSVVTELKVILLNEIIDVLKHFNDPALDRSKIYWHVESFSKKHTRTLFRVSVKKYMPIDIADLSLTIDVDKQNEARISTNECEIKCKFDIKGSIFDESIKPLFPYILYNI